MVAQHEGVRLRALTRALDAHLTAYEAGVDTPAGVDYVRILQNDAVLDLAVLEQHVVVNRSKRPHIRADHAAVLADDGRPADRRIDDLGVLLDDHVAGNLRAAGHLAVDAPF